MTIYKINQALNEELQKIFPQLKTMKYSYLQLNLNIEAYPVLILSMPIALGDTAVINCTEHVFELKELNPNDETD